MQRRLTITVSNEVNRGLHRTVGRGSISRYADDLLRAQVLGEDDLAALYREAAADEAREREVLEWFERRSTKGWSDAG